MARLAELRELGRLARRRTLSAEDYREFQAFQGRLILQHLARWTRERRGSALDLGAGLGGYTVALQSAGYSVVSVDRDVSSLRAITAAAHGVEADALALPFGGDAFDLVLCASLIEHVGSPERLLPEIARVLRPGGICYLSFPPFYSPVGGHQFAPFHLLGERAALWLYRRTRGRRGLGWRERYVASAGGYARAYHSYGLHPVTIARARSLIRAGGLEILDLSTRFLPFNTARWGPLGEVLTWHAQFVLRKPA